MSDDPQIPEQPLGSTGQLPVTGVPVRPAVAEAPRGPYVPTVVHGLAILAMAVIVFVWRLVDAPDWAVVGITVGVASGALLLLAAVASLVVHRARRERDFERMLSGS